MPPLTEFDRRMRAELFRKANGILKGKVKMASERAPMLSQVKQVARAAGIEHEKPAEIIKKVIAKGKVLNDDVAKLSGDEVRSILKSSLLMPRVKGVRVPMAKAKATVRAAETRGVQAGQFFGGPGVSPARAQMKSEGVAPRSASWTPGRGQGIQAKPPPFKGSPSGRVAPIARPAKVEDIWGHARVAESDPPMLSKLAISLGRTAKAKQLSIAKKQEQSGLDPTGAIGRAKSEGEVLSHVQLKPRTLTHRLVKEDISRFKQTLRGIPERGILSTAADEARSILKSAISRRPVVRGIANLEERVLAAKHPKYHEDVAGTISDLGRIEASRLPATPMTRAERAQARQDIASARSRATKELLRG